LELPGGDKILAEYFNEKNESSKNACTNIAVKEEFRNIISNNVEPSHSKNGDFIQQNGMQDSLLNNFKAFINQQDQFKHMLSSSFSVYMSAMLKQSQNLQNTNNYVCF
jgi:hypothetical protein